MLCFVCDGQVEFDQNNVNIFDEGNVLESGLKLSETVAQVIGRSVYSSTAHSSLLCTDCYRTCLEYDHALSRINEIKCKMKYRFSRTLPSYNLAYESYNTDIKMSLKSELSDSADKPLPAVKTLVLPKSKLTPLSSKMFLSVNQNKLPGNVNKPVSLKNCLIVSPNKISAVASSLSSQALGTSRDITKFTLAPSTSSGRFSLLKGSSNLISSPSKDFQGVFRNNVMGQAHITSEAAKLSKSQQEIFKTAREGNTSAAEGVPGAADGVDQDQKFVISEVEIMQEGQGDRLEVDKDTILMQQNGSVIRVMHGEQGELMFSGNDEISLVMPEEADSETDTSGGFKVECQDSNDDQLELEMSGDEETANAIIAAANNKGATYIKMDSGALFRIKTVKGRLEDDGDQTIATRSIVERKGDMFKCLQCESSSNGKNTPADAATAADPPELMNIDAVMQHVREMHCLRIFICRTCGEVFRKRIDLDKHQSEQHGDTRTVRSNADRMKQHMCTVCNKKYTSKNLLDEHMNLHTGVRPHTCDICHKSFISKYTYQAHMKTHTDRPRPFSCTECDKSFFTYQNLTAHLRTHSGVKEFVCTECDKAFSTQHNLDVHSIVHTGSKPFVCGVCDKPFARRAEIRDHLRTHTGERPFSCDICDATFSQRSNLLSHRRLTHFQDKRHECSFCGKRFKRRRLMDYHIKATHTGERPFKCEVCSATFIYPEHYKKHLRIHSGERPYVCEVCKRTFTSRDNRNAHRYTHSDKKPYECLVCGAGFMRKPQLYAHMNSQGHLADMIVVNQARLADSDNVETTHVPEEATVVGDINVGTTENLVVAEIKNFFNNSSFIEKINENSMETDSQENKEPSLFGVEEQSEAVLTLATDQQSDKETINLVEGDVGEYGLLPLTGELGEAETADALAAAGVDILTQGSHVITTDEEGNIVRLVQIQLPDGKTGWVALNP